ncbi:hypothetical protein XBJ1_0622 [Xenorhabdus bovienii SS-2004]|uniref:Uncharacterized protein n=1 Tax=Xenorhabdus bovienii (strain SS-2004) TaxID=406818 RepID=D3UWJ2_XENBS|nr:hypothetical protein XBJ1_0622 [Xenorhabdus bovienii SS-2004]
MGFEELIMFQTAKETFDKSVIPTCPDIPLACSYVITAEQVPVLLACILAPSITMKNTAL